MRLRKLIKVFRFEEGNRARIELSSANIRLNPAEHVLQLKADAEGAYPTTADIHAKTWVARPGAAKGWLLFQADVIHVSVDGTRVTGVGFRVSDGDDEYWWDGSDWVVNTTNWNTEGEVATNIAAFPVAALAIQFVVNLTTTDSEHTPKVRALKLLYNSNVSSKEDLLYRSFCRALRAGVQPIADLAFAAPSASASFDLNDYLPQTPYNIIDVDSVFDGTDDEDQLNDLLLSYNAATKELELSAPIPLGNTVWVRFIYEPVVAITTARDYTELDKVPAIVVSDFAEINSKDSASFDYVINRDTGAGWKVPAPRQVDIELTLRVVTDKEKDQIRLSDAVQEYFGQNPMLTSLALDERFRMWLIGEYAQQGVIGQEETHAGTLRIRIANALFYDSTATPAFAASRFVINGPPDVVVS